MDFGKLANIENIDFSLPAPPPETLEALCKNNSGQATKIYIGCPVWGDKDWVGKIYPTGTKPKEFLHYYATQFNSIELNGTHYNFPTEILIEKWKADVPTYFKFCPKLTQDISHFQRLVNTQGMVDDFCGAIRYLEQNLGTCFLQLPPNFSPRNIDDAIRFVEYWPKDVALSIEFRHTGWFSDKAAQKEMFAAMQYHNIGAVITDVAGRRDACHQRLTNSTVFIRFGANDLHPSDYPRMQAWAAQLHQWVQQGAKTIYFFLHTPIRHYNLELAIYMVDRLNKLGYNLQAPYEFKKPEKINPQSSLF